MTKHIPVLLSDVMRLLDPVAGETFYDATIGASGYAKALAATLEDGVIVGTDLDREAIEDAQAALAGESVKTCLRVENFRNLEHVLTACQIDGLDGAVFDLGFRSEQLTDGRGLSFQEAAPLIMTLANPEDLSADDLTARDVVNEWSADSLESILTGYGNEQYAEEIAAAIVAARENQPIETTTDLVQIVKAAVPHGYRHGKRHPATRTFQAIRIAVNDEIAAIEEGLQKAFQALKPGGRLAVVSFHSLEDRTVKRQFQNWSKTGEGQVLTKSPLTAERSELTFNPRARSAKLRAIVKNV